MIESFDVVFYTLAFVIPGFLIDLFSRSFIPQNEMSDQRNLLYYLALSCINYVPWLGLIRSLIENNYNGISTVIFWLIWLGFTFVSPLIIAFTRALFFKLQVREMLSKFFRINTMHPSPTAWDYRFNTIKQKTWVCIRLKDNTEIGGIWWTKSFASSSSTERDLYIEEVYIISKDGCWKKVDRTDGMLIKGDEIRMIHFIKDEREVCKSE